MTKAIAAVLPWAPKHERQAAIGAARAEKQRSQKTAEQARRVQKDIRNLYAENHWAASIADTLGIQRGDER